MTVIVGQTGVTVKLCVPLHPLVSVALTVNVAAVVLVGVPLRTPEELSVAQAGKAPLETVNV